jgi:hypothetical protein
VVKLKIDVGPGYRVYYSQRGTRLLLLLIGGDKSTQQKDITRAIQLARNFVARALGNIARAKGMTQVAKDAGLSRESL